MIFDVRNDSASEPKLKSSNSARLHLNESAFGLPPEIPADVWNSIQFELSHYPESSCEILRASISSYIGVKPEMVAVGNGIDELIMLASLTFSEENREILFTESTFPGYKASAKTARSRSRAISLVNFKVSPTNIVNAIGSQVSVVFICNPHNPTGSILTKDDLIEIIDAAEKHDVIPIFDEAYMDYVDDEDSKSAIGHVKSGRNALVLRTFSKAWGLASVRFGYMVGPEALVEKLWSNRGTLPFNVNRFAQYFVPKLLKDSDYINNVKSKNSITKSFFCSMLNELGIEYLESETNFLMINSYGDSSSLTWRLSENHQILVRDLSLFGIPGWIRASIGSEYEMRRLASALSVEIPPNLRKSEKISEVPHWLLPIEAKEKMTAAQIFNGFSASHAVQTLEQIGIWRELKSGPQVIEDILEKFDIPDHVLLGLLRTTTLIDITEWRNGRFLLTKNGQDVIDQIGYFTWGVGGYGRYLQNISEFPVQYHSIERNGELIAKGSGHIGHTSMLPVEQKVLKNINFTKAADIGCGDGSRIIRLLEEKTNATAIGIDINSDACEIARKNVKARKLENRATIHNRNILEDLEASEYEDVDLVLCFLMMHDILSSSDDKIYSANKLFSLFPNAKEFLIADTVRQDWNISSSLPIFSMEFELVHALSNIPLQSRSFYQRIFDHTGLEVRNTLPFGAPSTWLFHLKRPID